MQLSDLIGFANLVLPSISLVIAASVRAFGWYCCSLVLGFGCRVLCQLGLKPMYLFAQWVLILFLIIAFISAFVYGMGAVIVGLFAPNFARVSACSLP